MAEHGGEKWWRSSAYKQDFSGKITAGEEKVMAIVQRNLIPYSRGEREPLPAKRKGTGYRVVIDGNTVFLHTGEYEDGRLGEIFIHVNKQGTLINSLLDCFAIVVSKALQAGIPFDEFIESFAFRRFEPSGIVIDDDDIKFVDSIVSWIVRRLAIDYFGREDLRSGSRT